MHLDTTVSLGNLLMIASMAVGWIYQIGVMRTELRNLADRFVEHVEEDRSRFDRLDEAMLGERQRSDSRDEQQSQRLLAVLDRLQAMAVEQARHR
jgi:hypothetical protein